MTGSKLNQVNARPVPKPSIIAFPLDGLCAYGYYNLGFYQQDKLTHVTPTLPFRARTEGASASTNERARILPRRRRSGLDRLRSRARAPGRAADIPPSSFRPLPFNAIPGACSSVRSPLARAGCRPPSLPEGSPVNGEMYVHMAKTVGAVARTAPPIVSAVPMPTSDVLALLAAVLGL